MINKVTLRQLYRDTFRRSTLISIPSMKDLLETPGSEFTAWEIFYQIVQDALRDFEMYYPLKRVQKMYIEVDSTTRKGFINGNFEAYLKGVVAEDQIVITPSAVVGLSNSHYTASTYALRNFRYQTGEFTDFWYSSGNYYVISICHRPFIEEYDEVTKEPTDNCAVYFMNYKMDSQYTMFFDEVYLSLCRFIMNEKKNMMLSNLPIELFQGLEEDYNRMRSNQDSRYQQASMDGFDIM